jgi:2-succinyl-6-hydroxy-2,4-cyclohexadiene-1-carboxylate synthase
MGGRLALYFALHYPHRLRSLLLESSSPGLATAEERSARRQRDDELATWIEAHEITAFVARWEALPLWSSQTAVSTAKRSALRAQRRQNSRRGLANSLRGMGTGVQPPLWDNLPQLTLPVQLISGALDQKFVQINKKMAALLPAARLNIVPEAGHTVHWERPEFFAKIVEMFAV